MKISKRINEESIKHLAQHTQLIQSVGKDNMPQPVKILNVYKEETYDLYENRFISTLIKKLYIISGSALNLMIESTASV